MRLPEQQKYFVCLRIIASMVLMLAFASVGETQTTQWQQIVAAAKKEGKVVVSIPAGAELRKSLKDRFEKRYGIELELFTGRGAAVAKKIADEFRAGFGLPIFTREGQGQSLLL